LTPNGPIAGPKGGAAVAFPPSIKTSTEVVAIILSSQNEYKSFFRNVIGIMINL
jgi:hypothetical protein